MITVNDAVRGVAVLENQIDMASIMQGDVPRDQNFWIYSVGKENATNAPRLQIKISMRENDTYKFERECEIWEEQIRSDVAYFNQVKMFIQQLQSPFGFLSYDIEEALTKNYLNEEKEMEEEKKGDHPYFDKEK